MSHIVPESETFSFAFYFPMPDTGSIAVSNSPHNHIDVFLRRLAFVPALLRYDDA